MTKTKRYYLLIPLILILLGCLGYGGWMAYDANVDRSGWVEKDGLRIYRDFHGQAVSGWLQLAGGKYYFTEGGVPCSGWQQIDGERYHFSADGILSTGWVTIDGQEYRFDADGLLHEGWIHRDGATLYCDQGIPVTGWLDLEDDRYFFQEDGSMVTGLTLIDGVMYYLDAEGKLFQGDITLSDGLYRFREDGSMVVGWDGTGSDLRYFHDFGPMAVGWTTIQGKHYLFDEAGHPHTGWYTEGEYQYYFQEDGSAAVGPAEIDGQTHYFTPKGIEIILVNALNKVPSYYESELVPIEGGHKVDARCHDALAQMLADCNAAGIQYTFNSAYRSVSEQQLILDLRTKEHMENMNLSYAAAYSKALQTVAIPGTSEHHLGLAVDLLGQEAIAWFQEHCWDYGFILRYLGEKVNYTGIINEPWHFRYVGKEVALDIRDSGLCLEEYLGAEPVQGTAE